MAKLQSPSPPWVPTPGPAAHAGGSAPSSAQGPPHQAPPATPAPWAALCLTAPLEPLAPSAPLNSLAAGERQPGGSEAPNAITAPSRSLLPPPAPFIAEAGGREAEPALISAEKSRSGPDLWLAARDSSGTAQLRSIQSRDGAALGYGSPSTAGRVGVARWALRLRDAPWGCTGTTRSLQLGETSHLRAHSEAQGRMGVEECPAPKRSTYWLGIPWEGPSA